MEIIRAIIVFILLNNIATVQAQQGKHKDLYDTWKIVCSGNSFFDTDAIRTGLALDRAVQLASMDETPVDRYLDIVRRRISRGYLNSGFRDVQIATAVNAETGILTATIDEGFQFNQRDIVVTGLSASENAHLVSLLMNGANDTNQLRKLQPKLTYWTKKAAMPFVVSVEAMYKKTVHEALTAIGYPVAEFMITLSESSSREKHTVDLKVDVAATGATLTVGDITFTGLEKHTTEQMLAFLELKPGIRLTLPMRETITRKLLDSGRFLMADVTHEPFYFDPAEPLDLNIRVREYDLVAPLGEELTELQRTLMKTSEWLANWPNLGEDLHVRFSASTEHTNDVVKSLVPQEYHAFCDPALGTGNHGKFCVDFMTSPNKGSVITIQVTDPQGNPSLKRTVLLTKSEQGFLAWQHKRKWQKSNTMSVFCTQSMLGQWGTKDDNRACMMFGYGVSSDPEKGFRPEFKTTAAAVIHLTNRVPENEAFIESDVCHVKSQGADIQISRINGAILNLAAKTTESSFEIKSCTGIVEAELLQLQEATKDWKNECQPGRELPALAAMILEDIKANRVSIEDLQIAEKKIGDIDPSMANTAEIYLLLLDLLSNEPALDRWSKSMALMKENHTFNIPQEKPSTGNISGLLTCMPYIVPRMPPGSFPHQLGLTIFDARLTGDYQLLSTLLVDMLKEKKNGAIYCNFAARITTGTEWSPLFAKAGLERLSTAEFQNDVAPFIAEQSPIREMLCALLVWLQKTGDKEIETLASLFERNMQDKIGNPMNIRPLLQLIRSQSDKPAEDVLAMALPIVWEGGLRAMIEQDLNTLAAAPVHSDTKTYFDATAKNLNEAINAPPAENDATKKNPIKTISQGTSIRDIKLDEEWDLGK